MTGIKSAFILAGGKGERLRPLTIDTPKPLLPVKGKPILEWAIERLADYGVEKIVLGTGFLNEKVHEEIGNGEKYGVKINYSIEKEFLGTGGALKFAQAFFDGRFIMLNGDNLMDIDYAAMNELHERNSATGTIALVEVDEVEQYGVAELEGEKILNFIEKPKKEEAPSNLINAGAYILEKGAIDLMPSGFCLIEKTMFPALAEQGKLFGFRHGGKWFPTDTIERYEKAKKEW
ncbi:MAG: nucleotidyltransferase family protein [Candidatus Diapherotrites archaeon]